MSQERLSRIIDDLRALRKRLRQRAALDALDAAIYELEHGFNLANGIWIVEQDGASKRHFAQLSELPRLDTDTLAKLETRRMNAVRALTEAVEKTRRKMPGGETWWTYAPWDCVDAIFRALLEDGENMEF